METKRKSTSVRRVRHRRVRAKTRVFSLSRVFLAPQKKILILPRRSSRTSRKWNEMEDSSDFEGDGCVDGESSRKILVGQ
jgi:hypothetical protein